MYEFHITSSESADEGLSLLKMTNNSSTATATSLVDFALAECVSLCLVRCGYNIKLLLRCTDTKTQTDKLPRI